ncbi:MAG: GtrA family protein [Geminicoccaceae bacterium]|nr:GtrA family protein [Geminicoccaceae bacterium]
MTATFPATTSTTPRRGRPWRSAATRFRPGALKAGDPPAGLAALLRETGRFLGASLLATGLQYALLLLLVEGLGTAALAAAVVAFVAGAGTNYVLRRNFVFRRSTPHRRGIPRFAVAATVGLTLNSFVVAVGLDLIGLPYLAAQVLATFTLFFWNFVVHRLWTFGDQPTGQASPTKPPSSRPLPPRASVRRIPETV